MLEVYALFVKFCYGEIMKKLFLYIFLGLFLTSNSFSNIKDFQLEGMSIGDSFLDYYSKETQKELVKKDIKVPKTNSKKSKIIKVPLADKKTGWWNK